MSKKYFVIIILVLTVFIIGGRLGYSILKKNNKIVNDFSVNLQQNIEQPIPGKAPTSIDYKNDQYNFTFSLPISWQGYSIITDKWQGTTVGPKGDTVVATGPLLSIRHPLWTAKAPRQGIPIMVFTLKQWTDLQRDKFHIGAAPIGPSELGRNNQYVFALPARYNYTFQTGYEEVEKILDGKPLKTF